MRASLHEETLHQERCARGVARNLAKIIYKLKNADKATFYTPIEARAMPATTSKSPEEREFAVDSGASMHMLSKKDLRSSELDTLRKSRTSHNGSNVQRRIANGKTPTPSLQGFTFVPLPPSKHPSPPPPHLTPSRGASRVTLPKP